MLLALLLLSCAPKAPPASEVLDMPSAPTSFYPESPRGDVEDDYHGTPVADPYRWLEDSEAPETRAWIESQNALTFSYLDRVPERERIRTRMTELWNYERYGTPYRKGDVWFWTHNDGLQNQSVLYTGDSPEAEGRVLIDPNTLSEDGTVALGGTWPSEDGSKMVYAVSDAGSDWKTFRVLDVTTGEDLPDTLERIKFSGATWAKDGSGFWYSRYPQAASAEADLEELNKNQKLYFHRLGTEQADDELVYERPDQPEWGFGTSLTEDGRYLMVYSWQGTEPKNRVFVKDLQAGGEIEPVFVDFDAYYWIIGNEGSTFYAQTDRDAPRAKVVSFDLSAPNDWTEVVPQGEQVIESAGIAGGDKLLVTTIQDAHDVVAVRSLRNGELLYEMELPGLGSVGLSWDESNDTELFFNYTSFTTPGTQYRHDLESQETTLFRPAAVSMDEAEFVVEQVFYPSKDGTEIPMFLVHRADMELDGNNPTYLYGYGGFGVSLTPYYSTVHRVWLEMGGLLAIANLRGGGEYGQEWHDAGRLQNKQNVFDDFHAAAEYLIEQDYTQSSRIGIGGRSNGGLLVGAALTQRPDLYGAALPGVGVLDMLRFNKFTIGWAWESDYGSPEDPELFPTLYAYSPLHNVKEGTEYPPTLITTGDHDDRVVPGHSFKFAAELQRAQAGSDPILIRINTRAGHGAGKPTAMVIEEWTDQWGFLVKELGVELPEGF